MYVNIDLSNHITDWTFWNTYVIKNKYINYSLHLEMETWNFFKVLTTTINHTNAEFKSLK